MELEVCAIGRLGTRSHRVVVVLADTWANGQRGQCLCVVAARHTPEVLCIPVEGNEVTAGAVAELAAPVVEVVARHLAALALGEIGDVRFAACPRAARLAHREI